MYQQQQQEEQPPEKNRNSKDTHTRGPVCRLQGEGIAWLIATTAGQIVPERDQALHDKLVVRIHQETLAVKGSCLYYVHAGVSSCRRRSPSDNTAVSRSMMIRRTLYIYRLDTLNICNFFLKGPTKCGSYHTTAIILNSNLVAPFCMCTTTPPVKYNTI